MNASRLRTLKPRVPTLGSRVASGASWRGGKTSAERGYNWRWRRFRAAWLRLHPLCGDRESGPSAEHSACVREGRATPATDVDHIVDHKGDEAKFWDRANLQSLCHACHSVKTAAESG